MGHILWYMYILGPGPFIAFAFQIKCKIKIFDNSRKRHSLVIRVTDIIGRFIMIRSLDN